MPLSTGIDLVYIPKIMELLSNKTALERIFLPKELMNQDPAHLAGILAAKEALFKALNKTPVWHEVCISSSRSGKPRATISRSISKDKVIDLSISHDGDYAVAIVIVGYD